MHSIYFQTTFNHCRCNLEITEYAKSVPPLWENVWKSDIFPRKRFPTFLFLSLWCGRHCSFKLSENNWFFDCEFMIFSWKIVILILVLMGWRSGGYPIFWGVDKGSCIFVKICYTSMTVPFGLSKMTGSVNVCFQSPTVTYQYQTHIDNVRMYEENQNFLTDSHGWSLMENTYSTPFEKVAQNGHLMTQNA